MIFRNGIHYLRRSIGIRPGNRLCANRSFFRGISHQDNDHTCHLTKDQLTLFWDLSRLAGRRRCWFLRRRLYGTFFGTSAFFQQALEWHSQTLVTLGIGDDVRRHYSLPTFLHSTFHLDRYYKKTNFPFCGGVHIVTVVDYGGKWISPLKESLPGLGEIRVSCSWLAAIG